MKNWIIVLLIFVIPLGVFIYLESNAGKTIAKETDNTLISAANTTNTMTKTNTKPRMLKFFSPMCSDCKKISKEMANIPSDYEDIVVFEEINVSDGSKTSNDAVKAYNVTVVPTLIFVSKNGEVIQKSEGFLTEKEIRTSLNNLK